MNREADSGTLLMIGGGHAHALAISWIKRNRPPAKRIILVSDVSHAPYSGMLPGLIGGFYTFEQTHIDLVTLAKSCGVEFIRSKISGLNLDNKTVELDNGNSISFDLLSINVGSAPSTLTVDGADDFAVPVKPVKDFLNAWESLLSLHHSGTRLMINIVGGGAGGVELALNMRKRLGCTIPITLINGAQNILPTHNRFAQKILTQKLYDRKVAVINGTEISCVRKDGVISIDGREFPSTHTFWVTTASAQSWLKESGIDATADGFVRVNTSLQSVSHDFVFAAGDIAAIDGHALAKSGVFAVRQAKPLAENLCRFISGDKLLHYKGRATGATGAISFHPSLTLSSPSQGCAKSDISINSRWDGTPQRMAKC